MTVAMGNIRAAQEVIRGKVMATPMASSRTLSELTGADVTIKFENLQYTASFKERGALTKLAGLSRDERQRGVIALSAGNHAQGVAYHAGRLGIPATIVMPNQTPFAKVKHTEDLGARVLLRCETLAEAGEVAGELAREQDLVVVHPYDDPAIIAGQGTLALEMLAADAALEVLVVPVGGGGLIAGMAVAAKALKPAIAVVGAEAQLYPGLYAALKGRDMPVSGPTIADGIAVERVGDLPLAIARELVDDVILVAEDELERAVKLLLESEKTVAEGAGAAALAALLTEPARFAGKRVGLVLTGGNIDPRLLASVIMRGLVRDGRLVRVRSRRAIHRERWLAWRGSSARARATSSRSTIRGCSRTFRSNRRISTSSSRPAMRCMSCRS